MLARSRRIWASYTNEANSAIGLPLECVQLQNILGRVPAFPTQTSIVNGNATQLKLEHRISTTYTSKVRISGRSTWHTSTGKCNLSPRVLQHQLLLGTERATSCSFAEDSRFTNWPGVQNNQDEATEGNYLAILAFAWGYILSAKWMEMQQSNSPDPQSADHMYYLPIQAKWACVDDEHSLGDIDVDLGAINDDAARWWSAILATGEGWRATITRNDRVYQSPWSLSLTSSQCFKLRRIPGDRMPSNGIPVSPPSDGPPSFEGAAGFLFDFCVLHNIRGQCSAALAAALLFPFFIDLNLILPRPRPQVRHTSPPPIPTVSRITTSSSPLGKNSFLKTANSYLTT